MQNGCFCCTLQNDLVDQIIELASKKMFNYMLIEASGVSEPSQIAPLFDLCDEGQCVMTVLEFSSVATEIQQIFTLK